MILISILILLILFLWVWYGATNRKLKSAEPATPDYWIEYFPASKKYTAVYKGEYLFFLYKWSLRDHPTSFHMHRTKEAAEQDLKEFLEWYTKDGVQRIETNI